MRLPTRKTHTSISIAIKLHSMQRCKVAQSVLRDYPEQIQQMRQMVEKLMPVDLPGFEDLRGRSNPKYLEAPGDMIMDAPSQQQLALQDASGPVVKNEGAGAPIKFQRVTIDNMAENLLQRLHGVRPASKKDEAESPGKEKPGRKPKPEKALAIIKPGKQLKSARAPVKKLKSAKAPVKKDMLKKAPAKNVKPQKFPGVPKKAVAPIEINGFKVYSDLQLGCWRVKEIGERKDRKASWKVDPKLAWKRVIEFTS